MTRRPVLASVLIGLAVVCSGCGPLNFSISRIAQSPDGKTLYLSLNADGGLEVDDSSCLYALDVQSGRLKALSGHAAPVGWCSVSGNGALLAYQEGHLLGMRVKSMDLATGEVTTLTPEDEIAGMPEFVPGDKDYVIALAARSRKDLDKTSWVAYRGGKRFELLPTEGEASLFFSAAMAWDKALIKTVKVLDKGAEGRPPSVEYSLYVVGLSGDEPGIPVRVGEWKSTAATLGCCAVISPDGERITAVLLTEEGGKPALLDIDPKNARPPRTLLKEAGILPLASTPDGKAVVGLCADLSKMADFAGIGVWSEGDEKPRLLASLPANVNFALPLFTFPEPRRLRVVMTGNDGLRIVETNLDGTQGEGRMVSWRKLAIQRRLADIEWSMAHGDAMLDRTRPPRAELLGPAQKGGKPVEKKPDPKEEAAAKERAAVDPEMAPIRELKRAQDNVLSTLLDAEWKKVEGWEKVPVFEQRAK